ncbi:hypothetical protein [Sphingobacterium psychroaquaticum]|uniref:Uncharacterized protein n=1 Tax=Sphingobacterium psychroaquaticum TaxID=561061 RepID=A0A1X7K4Q3_9SPHI|nr:hypothetical protein [Sphingobacterium psychroaquaticum]SMG35793.1 hypothetical protein SAMN05660862_2549 [Sphingobacterium psychroaquaticum]
MRTTLSKPTHIEAVRDMAYNQMLQICDLLGWTEEYYSEHQLKEYELFLERRFHGLPKEILNKVRYSPVMAGLWKNEWISRNNSDFIPFATEMCTESMHVNELGHLVHYVPSDTDYATVYDEYCWLHNSKRLLNDADFMAQVNYAINLISK